MKRYKDKLGKEEFAKKEMTITVGASLIAGGVSAAITNPLECITVNK